MPNTYSKLHAQFIFAVKGRSNFIQNEWREEFYKYISGVVDGKSQKLYSIGGMPDHIHLFVGYKPSVPISDLVRDIKSNSSAFVNRKMFIDKKFQWQSGFGAFKEEYIQFLKNFNIEYDADYLFEFYD